MRPEIRQTETELQTWYQYVTELRRKKESITSSELLEQAKTMIPSQIAEYLYLTAVQRANKFYSNHNLSPQDSPEIYQEDIKNSLDEEIINYLTTNVDTRFDIVYEDHEEKISTVGFVKDRAIDCIDEVFQNPESSLEDLKKVALLSFDTDGLKPVNDLTASHTRGDEYLSLIAKVLHDPNSETNTWLREQGITEINPASGGGGDEFYVLIKSNRPIPPELLSEAITRFQNEIRLVDASHILDLTNPDILNRAHFNPQDIPQEYRYHAGATVGAATLYDGLNRATINPKDFNGNLDYVRAINKIMGGMWDEADEQMTENKKRKKELLRDEAKDNPETAFYLKLLARTDTQAQTEGENLRLQEQIAEQQTIIEKLQNEKREMAEIITDVTYMVERIAEDFKDKLDARIKVVIEKIRRVKNILLPPTGPLKPA